MMEIVKLTELLLFKQKRQDVALLYDLYFDYVSSRMSDESKYSIPSTFTLVSAFACVFYPELKLESGYTVCAASGESHSQGVNYRHYAHHWLIWNNENYIIDIVPIDGIFGVSTPQAVIQKLYKKRFFPTKNIYPSDWDESVKFAFNKGVEDIVRVLEELK